LRVSKDSHSGVGPPQQLSKSKTGRHARTVCPSRKCFIGILTIILSYSDNKAFFGYRSGD
jgi:hypothetical protein